MYRYSKRVYKEKLNNGLTGYEPKQLNKFSYCSAALRNTKTYLVLSLIYINEEWRYIHTMQIKGV